MVTALAPTYAMVVHLALGGIASLPEPDLQTCVAEARAQVLVPGIVSAECRVTFAAPHFVVVDPRQ